MRSIKTLLGSSLLALSLLSHPASATEKAAPIHFGDITWESGSLITEILRMIVEKGYGYPTDTLPGSTVTLETALAKNDIQVIGEEWAGRSPAWVKAEAEGKVVGLGDTVKGATEGWWVPEYVIKGDPAQRHQAAGAGPAQSSLTWRNTRTCSATRKTRASGRFLNSPIGWTSEVVNKQKLKAYGLTAQLRQLPQRLRRGAGCRDQLVDSPRQTGAVLLLVADAAAGAIQTGATGRAAVRCRSLENPGRRRQPEPQRHALDAGQPGHRRVRAVQGAIPGLPTFFDKVDLPIDLLNKTLGRDE